MTFLFEIFKEAVTVTLLVLIMMIVVDFLDVKSRGRFHGFIENNRLRQYVATSFLGVMPGCFGSFLNVSMYVHGFLSFGAIAAGMIATSGDEAFVMLTQFPLQALLLFAILFVIAIPLGWLADLAIKKLNIKTCKDCVLTEIHSVKEERSPQHYLKMHVWQHIIKKHIWRVFLWTFFAMLVVGVGLEFWSLEGFIKENLGMVLILSVLIGIIPESGPHLVFVMLFAQGVIPFSVLLASSISQDGHGLLPLLSYSLRDTMLIKLFNVIAALIVGGVAYGLGW